MSASISEGTKRRYGVERVCKAWGEPRSSFYEVKRREVMGDNYSRLPTTIRTFGSDRPIRQVSRAATGGSSSG
jgi:hypothetical protein